MHRRLLAPLYPTTGQETRRTNLDDSDTDPTSPARATATTTNRTTAAAAQVLARMQCPCCHATSAVPPSGPPAYPIVDAYGYYKSAKVFHTTNGAELPPPYLGNLIGK